MDFQELPRVRECIMARKNFIFLISFVFIQIPFILFSFSFLLQEFKAICPNQDFLSWDADLRFIKTLKMLDQLRHFEFFSFLFQILDSPTWPILRNLVQIMVFLLFGVSAYVDVLITLATFAILIGLVMHVLYYLTDGHWSSGLLFLPIWAMLFLSPPVLIYTFSAMLEIQGAVFFLASIYYLLLFYRSENATLDKWLLVKLSLSAFALFSTKYPYGYLLLLTILIIHTSLYLEEVVLFVTRYIAFITHEIKKQYRILGIILLVLIYLIIPESILKGKSKTYIKYIIVMLASIDFYLYLFRQASELSNLKFDRLTNIFRWVFLPIIVFVLIHPDRFSSSSSTLAHVQSEGHMVGEVVEKNLDYYLVFFKAITNDSFFPEWIGIILFVIMLLSVAYGYFVYFKEKRIENHFFFSLFSFLTILVLTFFTPNHQARHVYHLLPAIAVGALLLFETFRVRSSILYYTLLVLLSALVLIPFANKFSHKFSGENVCYTGKNKDDFFTPREVERLFKNLSENAIFFNFINPLHVNKADTELVLAKIAYENKKKILINPKNFKSNPHEEGYNEVYLIADSCEKEYLPETWFKNLHPSIKLTKRDDPKLSITYEVATKGKPFILAPPYPAKNLLERKVYRDAKFSTGEGCLQTLRFTILP